MIVICLNKFVKDSEVQIIYGNNECDDMITINFFLNKHFYEGLTLVFYMVDYSHRYHSSLRDDVELKENGFNIRFSFYLTANVATWAKYVRGLSKKEMKKIMEQIIYGESTSKTASKN